MKPLKVYVVSIVIVLFALLPVHSAAGTTDDPFNIYNDELQNKRPGNCRFLPGIEQGAEDMFALPNGMVIISVGLQFSRVLSLPNTRQGFMSFNLSAPDAPPQPVSVTGYTGSLNPHGLDVFQTGGKTFVYLVNHGPFNEHPPADEVLKFLWQVDRGVLEFQKSFTDPTFRGLNDLAVAEEDKFYITNFLTLGDAFTAIELAMSTIPFQNVVYFDGTKGTFVIPDAFGPNGVGLSPDKKFLYVNEIHANRITSYAIESPTKLYRIDSLTTPGPDNMDIDPETGDIWIGNHPIRWRFIKWIFTGTTKPPAMVTKVTVKNGRFGGSKVVLTDDELSVSTIAVRRKNWLLVGTVMQKAMICQCDYCDSAY